MATKLKTETAKKDATPAWSIKGTDRNELIAAIDHVADFLKTWGVPDEHLVLGTDRTMLHAPLREAAALLANITDYMTTVNIVEPESSQEDEESIHPVWARTPPEETAKARSNIQPIGQVFSRTGARINYGTLDATFDMPVGSVMGPAPEQPPFAPMSSSLSANQRLADYERAIITAREQAVRAEKRAHDRRILEGEPDWSDEGVF